MVSANKIEILRIAETVAQEKMIDKTIVIAALEEAIAKAAKSNYGEENEVVVEIDQENGNISISRKMLVVEEIKNKFLEINLKSAKKINGAAQIGDELLDPLPPLDFGRIAAQSAKQVINSKVREAERERQFNEYKDRVGEIVNGIVKRTEFGNIILDLGKAEGIVRKDQTIPRENLRNGDRVRAYIYDVRSETKGPQIFLSRSHPQFMAKLFTQEVPEIYDGIIEIKAVAREPGSRAKISVLSRDTSIDPVGACVGLRGSRVQAVVGELQGEKIEIIPFVEDPVGFVVNALAPAEVAKVLMDEVANRMEVVVPDDQLSLAIGRRGQNVRLASQLTGWYIDILTEAEESEKRQEEIKTRSSRFIEALNIDDVIAHLLVAEGFVMLEDIVVAEIEELADIQGFDIDIATEIHNRAVEFVDSENKRIESELVRLKVSNDLRQFEYLSLPMMLKLAENEILKLDDLAELDSEELMNLIGELGLDDEVEAGNIIMAARAHWFEEDKTSEDATKNKLDDEQSSLAD